MTPMHQPPDLDTEDTELIYNLDMTQGHNDNEEDKYDHDESKEKAQIQYNH